MDSQAILQGCSLNPRTFSGCHDAAVICDLHWGTDQDHSKANDFWHKKAIFKKSLSVEKECKRHFSHKFKEHCLPDIKWVLTYEWKGFLEVSLFLETLAADFDALKAAFSFHVNAFLILVVNNKLTECFPGTKV